MTNVVIGDNKFKIIDGFGFENSNSEVTFNDITIDFTDYTINDIPYKYQETQIQRDGDVLFTGYIDNIDLSHLTSKNKYKEMTLTLLSPLKMATKRYITLIGTFKLEKAITRILEPLVDDGFTIQEINVDDSQITLNYVLQTVEYAMNDLGYKRNIFWYIDEQKNIYVNSIDYMFGRTVKKIITDSKERGLLSLQPTIVNTDYANVINFKNVRLIYSTFNHNSDVEYPVTEENKTIKKGDTITFKHPIILDEEYLRSIITDENNTQDIYYDFDMVITLSDGTIKYYTSEINLYDDTSANYNKYVQTSNFSFNDDGGDEQEIVLQRDSFFSNVITGFKWNYDSDATIIIARSDTTLRYTTMKFMYSQEIEKLKGIISKTGQIEKMIDYEEKWTTLKQLIAYARSLIIQNSNTVNEVLLEYDENPNLKIGDIVEINRPNFFTVGKFAVKDIEYTYTNNTEQNWQITLKSTNLLSSYIDVFRPTEQQENNEDTESMILSEFLEESFSEVHKIQNLNTYQDLTAKTYSDLATKTYKEILTEEV